MFYSLSCCFVCIYPTWIDVRHVHKLFSHFFAIINCQNNLLKSILIETCVFVCLFCFCCFFWGGGGSIFIKFFRKMSLRFFCILYRIVSAFWKLILLSQWHILKNYLQHTLFLLLKRGAKDTSRKFKRLDSKQTGNAMVKHEKRQADK